MDINEVQTIEVAIGPYNSCQNVIQCVFRVCRGFIRVGDLSEGIWKWCYAGAFVKRVAIYIWEIVMAGVLTAIREAANRVSIARVTGVWVRKIHGSIMGVLAFLRVLKLAILNTWCHGHLIPGQ